MRVNEDVKIMTAHLERSVELIRYPGITHRVVHTYHIHGIVGGIGGMVGDGGGGCRHRDGL